MKIFIDSGDLAEINRFLSWGICDGVTTNPNLMVKAGTHGLANLKTREVAIAKAIGPRPVSVEVLTDDANEMLKQARQISKWAKNLMIKITVTDRNGKSLLPVVYQLAKEGMSVNVTTIFTLNQAMLAACALEQGQRVAKKKAPFPHAVSIFAGRIADEYGTVTAVRILRDLRDWLDIHASPVEIIVGSIHSPEEMEAWAMTGAHILTVPPAVLVKSQDSSLTKDKVLAFMQDAKKIGENK